MKIWFVAFVALIGVPAMGQFSSTLAPEEKEIAEKAFRAYTKTGTAEKLEVRRVNGRQAEVSGTHDTCIVDLVRADVARWETKELPAQPSVMALDQAGAVGKAKEYAAAHKFTLGERITAEQSAGIWRIRCGRNLNGYETPLADTLDVDRNGKVRSVDRDLLIFQPRRIKVLVQPNDAIDIARSKFAEKYGEAAKATCSRTAYEFAGSSDIEGRTQTFMAPRRLRLSHTVEIAAPGYAAKVLIDVIDGEIVRDEITPLKGAPRTGGLVGETKEKSSPMNSVALILFGLAILCAASIYYMSVIERIRQRQAAEEEMV